MGKIVLETSVKKEVILAVDTWIKNESSWEILWTNEGLSTPLDEMQTWNIKANKELPAGTYHFYSKYSARLTTIVF